MSAYLVLDLPKNTENSSKQIRRNKLSQNKITQGKGVMALV